MKKICKYVRLIALGIFLIILWSIAYVSADTSLDTPYFIAFIVTSFIFGSLSIGFIFEKCSKGEKNE